MRYKNFTVPDTAKVVKRQGSIITGSKDAIFLRNKYQGLLEDAYCAIKQQLDFLGVCNRKAQGAFHKAQSTKSNIEAHQVERKDLYKKLYADLSHETDIEKWMWEKTQEGVKSKTVKIEQRIKDTDIDEMHFGAVLDYLKQYPKLSSDPRYSNQQQKIFQKEKEIRQQKELYHEELRKYNHELSYFPKNLKIAEDKLDKYNTVKRDGAARLDNCRYRRSIFYKIATEQRKCEVSLQTEHHTIELYKNILNNFKGVYGNGSSKPLKEMVYN